MAVRRDTFGNIDRQEFENHLKAIVRKEGYIEIIMYTPDPSIQTSSITSEDVSPYCDITTLNNINKYASNTIATLEENLWLLDGRFIVYQGGRVNGYISESISDENGEFENKPAITVQLARPSKIENFSVILNPAVPTGYPKDITIYCYDANDNLIGQPVKTDIEWQEDTGLKDENDQPIYQIKLLESLPSVNFELNKENVDHLKIECGNTRFKHRRIRISSIMFGKTVVLNQDQVLNVDYTDKTSYVCDTLPSRVLSFDVNNYSGVYNVDNPENEYIGLDRRTKIRFRTGYNLSGYQYDENGYVIMEEEHPVVDPKETAVEIEWDNWKELRLMTVSANADESVTFTAGSLLDIMEDTYTEDVYTGVVRTAQQIAAHVLTFEGLDAGSIEWSSDGIKKPTYDGSTLLPYEQWSDTYYNDYKIKTVIPEIPCKQVIQLLAFSMGATILIKDDGSIKFANLNILNPNSFTNTYEWNYYDFTSIPAAEPLEHISSLQEISLPKYYSTIDYSGTERAIIDGSAYPDCTIIATVTCTAMTTEVTYSECLPVGCRIKDGDPFPGTISYTELYSKRGIIQLGGFVEGESVEIEIVGYPIKTQQLQERDITSNALVLDTKIMNTDISTYNPDGTIAQTEQIKRKYLEWYKKQFKYTFESRGEPLVNAGDYGIIQTQFTQQMPVYILQNHWTFNGAWSGDMEVIALE